MRITNVSDEDLAQVLDLYYNDPLAYEFWCCLMMLDRGYSL